MANYGSPYDGPTIRKVMQSASTKIQDLVNELLEINTVLSQIADADLKAAIALDLGITLSVGDEVDTEFAQVRDWQFHIKQLADNYTGNGSVSDVSFHVAKRVVI